MKLSIFNELDFLPALRVFFKDLQIPVNTVTDTPIAAQDIFTNTYKKENTSFQLIEDPDKDKGKGIYFLGMVDDAAFRGGKSLDISQIKSDYDGILIFGVTLRGRDGGLLPTRSQLAEISRAFNREFCYTPVVVVFKYTDANNTFLAFANTERLKYKDNREGEKAGKVTLLRDIDIRQPHSGHERILANLAIATTGKNKVDSFASLYKYWQEVLSVSLLNKDFYKDLSNWYFWAVGRVTFPSEPTLIEAQAKKVSLEDLQKEHKSKNVIRLLTRLLFVWFIKEKGLIPPELFELDDLQRDILKNISPYNDLGLFKQLNQESIYYKAILQNLFFATLNCPIKPMESHDNRVRGFRKNEYYGQNRDANFLMRYREHFQNPERFVEMVNSVVPFLNGGLFECLDDKTNNIFIDGFSDNLPKNEQLIVPDYLFFGVEEKVDLSEEYGVTNKGTKEAAVKGLINILKAYKFTITENTPIEEDVALDPELLGKVFENLLASYNPETKTTARKQTGSFYTPREIVNYMVDESLIAYLKNELLAQESGYQEEDLDRRLRQLVSFDAVNPFAGNAEVQKRIIKALDKCTILDPACGSGAFPMGILQKMVHILFKVDPKNTEWKQRQIVRVEAAISQLEELDDAQYREQGIQDLNAQIKDIEEAFANNELDYGRKLYLIENCIYGVDIQSIATQISKLRFFISLVVDQKVDPKSENNFGIRPLPNLETKFVAANTLVGIEKPEGQLNLFDSHNNPEIERLETELKKVRHRLFSSKSPSHKRKLREQDKVLREQIAIVLQKNGWKVDTANKLANWDPYNQNVSSPFFDPEWMFDISDGFDVVIGNPPYVFGGSEKISDSDKKYFKSNFASGTQKVNLFAIFIEKGIQLLKNEAYISYIIPNALLRVTSYSNIRKYIYNNSLISEVNDLDVGVFEGVTASTIIIRLQKNKKAERSNLIVIKKGVNSDIYQQVEQSEYSNKGYILDIFTKKNDRLILQNLESNSTTLGEITKMIRFGVVITKNLNDVVSDSKLSNLYKPFLEGDEISSFGINYRGRFLKYEPSLLHRSRTPDVFEENKIMIQRITGGSKPIKAVFDNSGFFNKESILNLQLISDDYSYYYILSLLNSSTINWFYKQKFTNNSKLTVNLSKEYLEQIPIKKVNTLKQSPIIFIGKFLSFAYGKGAIFDSLYNILDATVLDLYFSEHMKEREIDVLGFVKRDIEKVLQGWEFDSLSDSEKAKVIELLHTTWSNPDNEVRDRIKLFAVRSPDILKPILESK